MSQTRTVGVLPVDPTTFIGREAEISEIREALMESPVVTLLGSGGVGKTRLAVRAAVEITSEFPDGVVFVDLSSVAADAGVVPAIASALGVQAPPGATGLEAVAEHVRHRQMLLLVDNCEQVADACATVTDRLVDSGGSRILATSRVPLRARAETIVVVSPLELPTDVVRAVDSEAVRLFVDRARRVRRPFTLDATNTGAVVDICHLLDGLPLAIELAAARIRAFGPEQLANELRTHGCLLRDDSPSRPDRHRSLTACVEWSFGLLDQRDRTLAARLSVFAGGFDLEAARAVCSDDDVTAQEIADLLGRLVDASIVAVDHRGPAERFRLLDTIRHHAGSLLVDDQRWRLRHLVWCEAAAHRIAATHRGDDSAAHAAFTRERENLFSAVEWATLHGHVETAMRVIGAMWRVCSDYGLQEEIRRLVDGLLDACPDATDPAVRLGALLASTAAAQGAGDLSAAIARGTEAAAVAEAIGDHSAKGWALTEMGYARLQLHDPGARDDLVVAAGIGAEIGNDSLEADALVALGFSDALTSSVAAGTAQMERAVALAGECAWLLPAAWGLLGSARLLGGDIAGAITAFDATLDVSRRRPMGHHFFFTPFAIAMRAIAIAHQGRGADARDELVAALSSERDPPHLIVRSVLEVGLAIAHQATGDAQGAATAYERSLVLALDPFWMTWARLGLAELAVDAGDLATARVHVEAARDATRRSRHTFHLAWLDLVLARIARAAHDEREARARSSAGLLAAVEHGNRLLVPGALESVAELALARGDHEVAARLLGAADGERIRTGHTRPTETTSRLAEELERVRPATAYDRFERLRREAAARPVEDVLTIALAGRGPRRRPTVGWGSLTPAERNVVRLVGEGLSNAEIGERLFISRRTVERHLSNVFTKTGVTSRTQLAAEAARDRVIG